MKKIIKQLEFFGYKVNKENDYFIAERDHTDSFIITKSITINFAFGYSTNNNGFTNHNGFLKYINDLNVSSLITTFMSKEKGRLEFSAHYTGLYDIKTFSEFIRAWEYDIDLLHNNKDTDLFFQSDNELDTSIESYNENSNFKAEA